MTHGRVTLDGDRVAACPACDDAPVSRRDGDPKRASSPEHTYACYECGWRGDEYNPRDSRHNQHMEGNVKPREGTVAYELDKADPGDLVTDGGLAGYACPECSRVLETLVAYHRHRDREHGAPLPEWLSPDADRDPEQRTLTDGGLVAEHRTIDPVDAPPERLEGCWARCERGDAVLTGEIYAVRERDGERWLNVLVPTADDGKRGVGVRPERDREQVTVVEDRTAFEEGTSCGP